MSKLISLVLVIAVRNVLAHPVEQEMKMIRMEVSNPIELTPEHTGSIFGGLHPDNEDYEDYYYDDDSNEPEELPLPAGPTRRPVHVSPLPIRQEDLNDKLLGQFANLPLLTTKKPVQLHSTTMKPTIHFGEVVSTNGQIGNLMVHSSMNIVDQTHLFSKMDPFQEQFISPPRVNAGALPLSNSFGGSLFPPFDVEDNMDKDYEDSL